MQELSAQARFWRNFNRYYFNRLRTLRAVHRGWGLHGTEHRVLREIGEAPGGVNNAYIAWKVNIDRAQVTRIVAWFRHLGWIEERRNTDDRRIKYFSLTPAGRHAFTMLDRNAHDATELFLSYMMPQDRVRFVAALAEVQELLAGAPSYAGA